MTKFESLFLSSTPQLNWHDWSQLDILKNHIEQRPHVSRECFIFIPEKFEFQIAKFNFHSLIWTDRNYMTYQPFQISHWTFLPHEPEYWYEDSETYLNKLDEWSILEQVREDYFNLIKNELKIPLDTRNSNNE